VRLGGKAAGVVTLCQLRNAGLNRAAVRWQLECGHLVRLFGRVFRFQGAPQTWEQHALGVTLLLGKGCAVSHQSAAFLWGLSRRKPDRIDISIASRGRKRLPNMFELHRPRNSFLVQRVQGLPVTSVVRTLLDCAVGLDEERLELMLDLAQQRHPTVRRSLIELFGQFTPQTVPGLCRLKKLVELRGEQAAESPLETLIRRRLRLEHLDPPVLQHDLFDHAGFITRVDFAWPQERVAVHADSFRWHSNRVAFDLDAQQRTRLAALGWISFVVTAPMVSGDWTTGLRRILEQRAPQGRFALD
jgi:hypothetical protein